MPKLTDTYTHQKQEGLKDRDAYLVLGCTPSHVNGKWVRSQPQQVYKRLVTYFESDDTHFLDDDRDLPLLLCTHIRQLDKALRQLTEYVHDLITPAASEAKVCRLYIVCDYAFPPAITHTLTAHHLQTSPSNTPVRWIVESMPRASVLLRLGEP